MASGHVLVRNDPDIPVGIDGIWADEKLIALLVNHAVCRCPANAFRTDDLLQVRSYFIKFVG